MRAKELFSQIEENLTSELFRLRQCTQFLNESMGYPLFKNLPMTPTDEWFKQIKVRHHKKENPIIESFNQTFEAKFGIQKIHQRAIFTTGEKTFRLQEGCEAFYVFPVNQYNFLYNSASSNVQATFEQLQQSFNEETVKQIMSELLGYTYTSKNLGEGINQGAEVLMFGIPYYYAVKQAHFPEYEELYKILI